MTLGDFTEYLKKQCACRCIRICEDTGPSPWFFEEQCYYNWWVTQPLGYTQTFNIAREDSAELLVFVEEYCEPIVA